MLKNGNIELCKDASGVCIARCQRKHIIRVCTSPCQVHVWQEKPQPSFVLSNRWSDIEMRDWLRHATGKKHLVLCAHGAVTVWGTPSHEAHSACIAETGITVSTNRHAASLPFPDVECIVLARTKLTNTFDLALLHKQGHVSSERLPAHMLQVVKQMLSPKCKVIDLREDAMPTLPSARPPCGWAHWILS